MHIKFPGPLLQLTMSGWYEHEQKQPICFSVTRFQDSPHFNRRFRSAQIPDICVFILISHSLLFESTNQGVFHDSIGGTLSNQNSWRLGQILPRSVIMFSNIQQQRMHIPEHKVVSSICTLEIEDGYWKLSFFCKRKCQSDLLWTIADCWWKRMLQRWRWIGS